MNHNKFNMRVFAAVIMFSMIMGLQFVHAAPAEKAAGESLFTRLGGFDAIAAVTDDFLGRLATDPQLGRLFVGHSDNSMARTRQLVVEFICKAAGGPCVYIGRDMPTTHKGLGITADDWNISMGHLAATLDKFQVPEPERTEVTEFIAGLRDGIVDAEIAKDFPKDPKD